MSRGHAGGGLSLSSLFLCILLALTLVVVVVVAADEQRTRIDPDALRGAHGWHWSESSPPGPKTGPRPFTPSDVTPLDEEAEERAIFDCLANRDAFLANEYDPRKVVNDARQGGRRSDGTVFKHPSHSLQVRGRILLYKQMGLYLHAAGPGLSNCVAQHRCWFAVVNCGDGLNHGGVAVSPGAAPADVDFSTLQFSAVIGGDDAPGAVDATVSHHNGPRRRHALVEYAVDFPGVYRVDVQLMWMDDDGKAGSDPESNSEQDFMYFGHTEKRCPPNQPCTTPFKTPAADAAAHISGSRSTVRVVAPGAEVVNTTLSMVGEKVLPVAGVASSSPPPLCTHTDNPGRWIRYDTLEAGELETYFSGDPSVLAPPYEAGGVTPEFRDSHNTERWAFAPYGE